MDLNRLYFDHQISLMRASLASDCVTRNLHDANARAIAREVAQHQKAAGAGGAARWEAASFAGRHAQ